MASSYAVWVFVGCQPGISRVLKKQLDVLFSSWPRGRSSWISIEASDRLIKQLNHVINLSRDNRLRFWIFSLKNLIHNLRRLQ